MAKHSSRFYLRSDQAFLETIDDWRRRQTPIPSRARAVRDLALRGASADQYLATILEQTIERLAKAGLIGADHVGDLYPRLQRWVVENLDFAAKIDALPPAQRLQALLADVQENRAAQETPAAKKYARGTQPRSR